MPDIENIKHTKKEQTEGYKEALITSGIIHMNNMILYYLCCRMLDTNAAST